jgi:hypothetical protein
VSCVSWKRWQYSASCSPINHFNKSRLKKYNNRLTLDCEKELLIPSSEPPTKKALQLYVYKNEVEREWRKLTQQRASLKIKSRAITWVRHIPGEDPGQTCGWKSNRKYQLGILEVGIWRLGNSQNLGT